MAKYLNALIIPILLLVAGAGFATSSDLVFQPEKASQQLDTIHKNLPNIDKKLKRANNALLLVDTLREKADTCVSNAQSKLTELQKQLKELKPTAIPSVETKAEQYLKTKTKELTERRGECQIVILRAKELHEHLSVVVSSLEAEKRLQITASFWQTLQSSPEIIKNLGGTFNTEKFKTKIGAQFSKTTTIFIVASVISIEIILYLLIGLFLKRWNGRTEHTTSQDIKRLLTKIVSRYRLALSLTLSMTVVASILYTVSDNYYFLVLSLVALFCVVALMMIRFFLHPKIEIPELVFAPPEITSKLALQLRMLVIYLSSCALIYISLQDQPLPDEFFILSRTLFATLLAFNLAGIIWLLDRGINILKKHRRLQILINSLLVLGLVITLLTEWLGYRQLTDYLLSAVTLTLLLIFATVIAHKSIQFIFESFSPKQTSHEWQKTFNRVLGIKKSKNFTELVLLKFATITLLWGCFFILLLEVWGLPQIYQDKIHTAIFEGIFPGGLETSPWNFLMATYVYALLSIATRAIRTTIARQTSARIERGVKNSLAAIVGYIGFAVSLIIAMIVAGINFQGIAIIAGALSVGIGFGLQNIVNNFVSGLVLLLERPIKIGDRIVVGNVDGHVTKIRSRSTVIRTRERTDVIIPNAQLISEQVDNLMFENHYQRMSLLVGIAYGSDTKLAHDTLLEVANDHPEVLQIDGQKPLALFNGFGESSLEFELRVVIEDVDRRQIVRSELNFAIERAFRAKDIEIAFPQLDVHFKNAPPSN
jgi:potassium-dependent mechanosensitive channel